MGGAYINKHCSRASNKGLIKVVVLELTSSLPMRTVGLAVRMVLRSSFLRTMSSSGAPGLEAVSAGVRHPEAKPP